MEKHEEAAIALRRMQDFDPKSLLRREELGALAFQEAVEPAQALINFYKLLPTSTLADFPDPMLDSVLNAANQSYAKIEQILKFDQNQLGGAVPRDVKASFITQLINEYTTAFQQIYALIAYAGARAIDFGRVESDARKAIAGVSEQGSALVRQMETSANEAARILGEVRQAAQEQGVSQQAIYFKNAADDHEGAARRWQNYTVWTAIALGGVAFAALFANHIPLLTPTTQFESAQLIVGKVLLFGVLAYMVVLCARNFFANRHNAIVNRHRQNALVTFKALADAASEDQRDIVLTHAAACIFAPQETGFARAQSAGNPQTLVELLPRLAQSGGHG